MSLKHILMSVAGIDPSACEQEITAMYENEDETKIATYGGRTSWPSSPEPPNQQRVRKVEDPQNMNTIEGQRQLMTAS